jgi:ketosteroid isomerase-like protein
MSQENVEIVRRGYEMYASGDLEGLVALIAPDAKLADAGGLGITGRASGTPLDAVVFQLWELSDGKVVRSQIFMTESQALEAVGLSE